MIPLLFFASFTTALVSSGSASENAGEQIARTANNGEFISKHYPTKALKRGEQGRVGFRVTIEPDGSLGACDVTQSSGFATLDKETCEIMVSYARLSPVRNADGRAIRADQDGYIVWRLPAGATRVASASGKKALDPNKIVCKRIESTGSLIAKTRQCLTRSEWAQQERVVRDEVDRIQGRGVVDCKSTGAC